MSGLWCEQNRKALITILILIFIEPIVLFLERDVYEISGVCKKLVVREGAHLFDVLGIMRSLGYLKETNVWFCQQS